MSVYVRALAVAAATSAFLALPGTAAFAAERDPSAASRASTLHIVSPWDARVGVPYVVGGFVAVDAGNCEGPTAVTVTRRTAATTSTEKVVTDEWCHFELVHVQSAADSVTYAFAWAGDAAHDGASREVVIPVERQDSWFSTVPSAPPLRAQGGRATLGGVLSAYPSYSAVAGVTLSVSRTDVSSGQVVTLSPVPTDATGAFAISDRLPRNDGAQPRDYAYSLSYAGDRTHAPVTEVVVVTVLARGR